MNIPAMINVIYYYRQFQKEGILPIIPVDGTMVAIKVGDELEMFTIDNISLKDGLSTVRMFVSLNVQGRYKRIRETFENDVNWREIKLM